MPTARPTDVPLQIEHLTPRARGGSNRVSNLTLACEPCNVKKGTQTAAEFGFPDLQAQAKLPLERRGGGQCHALGALSSIGSDWLAR